MPASQPMHPAFDSAHEAESDTRAVQLARLAAVSGMAMDRVVPPTPRSHWRQWPLRLVLILMAALALLAWVKRVAYHTPELTARTSMPLDAAIASQANTASDVDRLRIPK